MRPFSPSWADPLHRGAPGRVTHLKSGLRARIVGDGEPRVFLHGLGASLRYWGRGYDQLSSSHRLVFLDLLGFGGSAKPEGAYDAAQHTAAVEDSLAELDIRAATLVGHSAGALIAMHYAAAHPAIRVVAFGAPVFFSETIARRHLRSLGPLARLMADESPWAQNLCTFTCEHRELARRAAPLFAPRLPAPIASDGVDHVWDSYKGTFDLVVSQQDVPRILAAIAERLTLIYGRDDRVCPQNQVEPVVRDVSGVKLIALPVGDHHLPLQFPARCRELIRDVNARSTG